MRTVVNMVYQEDDYSIFFKLDDNRDVTERRIEEIKASVLEREVLNPIIVNKKMEIIDGQGRYEVFKELGLPIKFVIDEDADINDCRRMNSCNKKWELLDFVKSFARQGNESYLIFLELLKELRLNINLALRLANRSGHINKRVKGGTLQFAQEDSEAAKYAYKCTHEIIEALAYEKSITTPVYIAVRILLDTEGYDHKKMLLKCAECRSSYHSMSSVEAQVAEFERIYNKGARTRHIYFSDYFREHGNGVRDYSTTKKSIDYDDVSTLRKKTEQ